MPNNSKEIATSLFNKKEDFFCDVKFIELPVNDGAITVIRNTAPLLDLVLILGEDDTLKDHALYEKESKNDKIIRNTLNIKSTKYLKQNSKYDPFNDYVCNDVNYYLISNVKNSLFIHVPTQSTFNKPISCAIEKKLRNLRSKITHHKILAENLHPRDHEVGFELLREVNPVIGKLFTSKTTKRHEMTMENTLIPLDILFLHENHQIKLHKIGLAKQHKLVKGVSKDVLEMPFPYCYVNCIQQGDTVQVIDVNPDALFRL